MQKCGYQFICKGLLFSSKWGVPNILGGLKVSERKKGGHKIFDDQNVGSYKMQPTDSVFILFEKINFNTILACLGGKVYR